MTLTDVLAWAAVVWFSAIVGIGCLGLSIARTRYAPPFEEPIFADDDEDVPGVSILRPLSGLDSNLYENLEASFRQRYPSRKLEIIFCVAREGDQAIEIVQTLMRCYPDVDARLLIGESNVGANPKVNNLARAYREAKHDLLWILDSNVLTSFGTLARSVKALQQPRIGLVHHVPFALFADSELGSGVEHAFLGTQHAKMYLALNYLAIDSCLVGKSMLFRRSDLDRATSKYRYTRTDGRTGIEALGAYLGEDNVLGSAIWHGLGLRHAMTSDLAGNTVGSMTVQQYFWRRVRWIRVRKYMATSVGVLCAYLTCLHI